MQNVTLITYVVQNCVILYILINNISDFEKM